MHRSRSILLCTSVFLLILLAGCRNKTSESNIEKTRVLVVAGGHSFDTTEWSGVPDSLFSTYKHDIDIQVSVTNGAHPVSSGMKDFVIHDEGYGNIVVSEDVEVLLSTTHPECSGALAWVNTYNQSKIVYIMLGHDKQAYNNKDFRAVLVNAINYTAAD